MPRYPGARWRPVSGHTDGPMRSYRGAVLHVNESTGDLYNWVAGDHDMSCHFEVYKDGTVDQYLDTATSSWCQEAGNWDWISIETEGYATDPLTAEQVHAIAGVYAWLHAVHGITLQLAETAAGLGFGWHGMGGPAWGGHLGCPGEARKAQRAEILALIEGGTDLTPEEHEWLEKIAAACSQDMTHPGRPTIGGIMQRLTALMSDTTHSNTIPGLESQVAAIMAKLNTPAAA